MSFNNTRIRLVLNPGTKPEPVPSTAAPGTSMRDTATPYPGQFDAIPHPLYVAIPRDEILKEMARRGDERALNDVCMAVAVAAEAVRAAWLSVRRLGAP